MPRIIAVIAARMGSERLPGKTLCPIEGKPLLGHLLDRALRAKTIDGVMVATPESPENDPVAAYCASLNIPCFRGSESDVADRMNGALEMLNADVGVQLYGDSPVIDPAIIDLCVNTYKSGEWDWVGNDLRPGFSSGQFAEVFSMRTFKDALSKCNDPAVREHGTLCLRREEGKYRIHEIAPPEELRHPEICLSVDSEEDAALMDAIFGHFAPRNDFTAQELYAFLEKHSEIAGINKKVERRWKKYQKKA
ncbi:MAG: NTP transferase domain-containing protein [Patescibacteria group bacterium]